jgi:hypothetical protein
VERDGVERGEERDGVERGRLRLREILREHVQQYGESIGDVEQERWLGIRLEA